MPKAILLAPQTRSLVAQHTEQSLADIEAMLENTREFRREYGPAFVVIDLPGEVHWTVMHKDYFESLFDLDGAEEDVEMKFVPVKLI